MVRGRAALETAWQVAMREALDRAAAHRIARSIAHQVKGLEMLDASERRPYAFVGPQASTLRHGWGPNCIQRYFEGISSQAEPPALPKALRRSERRDRIAAVSQMGSGIEGLLGTRVS